MLGVAVPPPTLPDHYPPDPRDQKHFYDTQPRNPTTFYPPQSGTLKSGISQRSANPDPFYPPQSSATLKSSSGVSSRSNTDYLGSRYPRDHTNLTEGHEYLEVDVISRIRSLQNEIDLLRCNVNQGSDGSNKSKDSCIYEKIETMGKSKRDYAPNEYNESGLLGHCYREAKARGLFRLSNICNPAYTYCRFFWLTLILAALCMTSYQIFERITHYQSTPRRMYVENRGTDKLPFPKVTICNLNTIRLSRVADMHLYGIIHTLQHTRPQPPYHSTVTNFTQLAAYKLTDFMKKTRHLKEDLVHKCQWQSRPCTPHNFSYVFTGREYCVAFELQHNNSYVDVAGSHSGLYLVLNVEQYEYILGPNSAVGAKIALHMRDNPPRSFVHLPVGKMTSVEITKMEYEYPTATSLEHLLGMRSEWTAPDGNCGAVCRETHVVKECGCALPSTSVNEAPAAAECSMMDWYSCVQRVIDQEPCGCKHRHEDTDGQYKMSLSYAAIPKYGIESELRGMTNRDVLEKRFRESLDLYHTYDSVMVRYDTDTLDTLLTRLANCTSETRALSEFTTQYSVLYKEKTSQLKDTFTMLSLTSKEHYLYFEASSHISFTSVITILKKAMAYLLGKEVGPFDKKPMIRVIIEQLKTKMSDITNTDTTSSIIEKKLIAEIDDGINLFREKLITGYGQNYKELRNKLSFYNDLTLKMRNVTHILKNSIVTEYSNIKRIKDTDSIQSMQTKLGDFFKRIKSLNSKEMKELDSYMESLVTAYRDDKKSILKSLQHFNDTTFQFSLLANSMSDDIIGINSTLSSLSEKIKDANVRLKSVTDSYKKNVFGKSEYSDKMNEERIQGVLRHVKDSSKDLSSKVRLLQVKSSTLNNAIHNTTTINFGLFASKKNGETMKWFSDSPLVDRLLSLMGLIDETMRDVDEYRKELDEYTASRRVNEAFYRNNFLHLDIFFKEMAETVKREYISYTLIDLTSDIGCTLALYLGASILTIFQLIEYVQSSSSYVFGNKNRD